MEDITDRQRREREEDELREDTLFERLQEGNGKGIISMDERLDEQDNEEDNDDEDNADEGMY